jgi:hypothetical protein
MEREKRGKNVCNIYLGWHPSHILIISARYTAVDVHLVWPLALK